MIHSIVLINGVDVATIAVVALFMAFILGYIIYRKVHGDKMTGCSCAKGKDMIKYYHCQKRKNEKKAKKHADNDTCCCGEK